jgi:TRAP-type C4-dicarboxylate transport system substrate-binding protein
MSTVQKLSSGIALTIAFSLSGAASAENIKLRVIGQPLATGLIQKNKEQPFFEQLANKTGLPIEIEYKPIDSLGVKDTEQLRVLKSGLFDIVSLRVLRNSRDEPSLLGLDLVGASPDYQTGRKVMDAYFNIIDEQLQKQFNIKLLGVWPFGPQILFCRKPITSLASIKGMKVRVIDQNLAKFIDTLGATPVPMSFPDTHQSLSLGVVDCAVTDASSANSAAWPEVTTHQLPIGFQMSPNAYAITLKSWNRLDPEGQEKLRKNFSELTDEIWSYSEKLHQDALNCNSGKDSCTYGKKYSISEVPVSASDIELVRNSVSSISLPTWAETCDKSNPGCSEKWKAAVGPVLGLELK